MNLLELLKHYEYERTKRLKNRWSRSNAPKSEKPRKPPVPKPRKPVPKHRVALLKKAKKARNLQGESNEH